MRRWVVACAALVLLAGCAGRLSTTQGAAFEPYLHQLVGSCAQVDRKLATSNPETHPGQFADQFAKFASQARSHHPPQVKRQQLDTLLTAFDEAARQYRSAQAALSSGNTDAARTAVEQAKRTMVKADIAGQRYGMPHLKDCPKQQGGSQPSAAPTQLAGTWQLGHDSPFVVQQVPAAVLGGRVWVAGGLTGPEQATKKTEVYDPTVHIWGSGPALPIALNHAMMVTYRNTLWVIGGFVPRGGIPTAGASAQVWILDKINHRWINGPALHHVRAAGAAAVVGGKIVVAGGRTGDPGKLVTATEVFDGTSWHNAPAIPVPGDHLAAASDGTYLYAVGGDRLTTSKDLAAVQRFNPATGQWTQLPPMRTAASGLGAAIIGRQLITLGGENLLSVFRTVRAYNLDTKKWSSLPDLPAARHGMGVAAIGNTLYAIDGAAKPGHNASTRGVQVLRFHR
jgi:N-acetylneuraminic acid mutarotase